MIKAYRASPFTHMIQVMNDRIIDRRTREGERNWAGLEDEALLAAVVDREQKAYAELVQRHLKRIHAFCYRHLGSEAEAEEVTQETFLRLWTKADTYQTGRARVDTWMHRIAYNLCIDIIRRRRQVALDDIAEPEDERQDQFRDYFDGQISDQVNQALTALPERQRAALVLSHYQGLSNPETAETLDVSVEAVESLLARGRRALKKSLADTMSALKPEGA